MKELKLSSSLIALIIIGLADGTRGNGFIHGRASSTGRQMPRFWCQKAKSKCGTTFKKKSNQELLKDLYNSKSKLGQLLLEKKPKTILVYMLSFQAVFSGL